MSLYPLSRLCPKCGAEPGKLCSNTPAQPCDERWGNLLIDTDKLRARAVEIVVAEAEEMGWCDDDLAAFRRGEFDGDDLWVLQAVERAILAMAKERDRSEKHRNDLADKITEQSVTIGALRADNLTLARENSQLRCDVAVMRENDCNEVKALKADIERHLSALSAEAEENARLREALEAMTKFEDAATRTVARRALGKDKT